MYNKITLLGNTTRDIELRYSPNGSAIAKTAIATSHKYKVNGEQREDVCYIDLTFFGRSAEIANQYLQKGSKILVEGRLNFEQWVDNNSQKRSKHSVIVEVMKMVESKSALENRAQNNTPAYQQQSQHYMPPVPTYQNAQGQQVTQQQHQQQTKQYQQRPMPEQVPVIDIDEDKIPF